MSTGWPWPSALAWLSCRGRCCQTLMFQSLHPPVPSAAPRGREAVPSLCAPSRTAGPSGKAGAGRPGAQGCPVSAGSQPLCPPRGCAGPGAGRGGAVRGAGTALSAVAGLRPLLLSPLLFLRPSSSSSPRPLLFLHPPLPLPSAPLFLHPPRLLSSPLHLSPHLSFLLFLPASFSPVLPFPPSPSSFIPLRLLFLSLPPAHSPPFPPPLLPASPSPSSSSPSSDVSGRAAPGPAQAPLGARLPLGVSVPGPGPGSAAAPAGHGRCPGPPMRSGGDVGGAEPAVVPAPGPPREHGLHRLQNHHRWVSGTGMAPGTRANRGSEGGEGVRGA